MEKRPGAVKDTPIHNLHPVGRPFYHGAYCSEGLQLWCQSVLLHTKEYDEHRNMNYTCIHSTFPETALAPHFTQVHECGRSVWAWGAGLQSFTTTAQITNT